MIAAGGLLCFYRNEWREMTSLRTRFIHERKTKRLDPKKGDPNKQNAERIRAGKSEAEGKLHPVPISQ